MTALTTSHVSSNAKPGPNRAQRRGRKYRNFKKRFQMPKEVIIALMLAKKS